MREKELYEPIRNWIGSPEFSPNKVGRLSTRYRKAFNTSELQWLEESGEWLKPDVTLIKVSQRKYESTPELSVHSVEIKPKGQSLISGLFQALAYSRISDYCYLAAPKGADWKPRVDEVAERFGIGLIKFDSVTKWETYETRDAKRMLPDADLRDEYIDAILTHGQDRSDILELLGRDV